MICSDFTDRVRSFKSVPFYQGLSRSQIAEKLNLPVGTVKSHVRLAFVQLKRILAAQINQ